MGAGNTQAGAVIWLIILLFPSLVWAAQIEPAPVIEEKTTGNKTFVVGRNPNPMFTVPDKNRGSLRFSVPCDPGANISVEILRTEDGGKTWKNAGKFTRKAGSCLGPGGTTPPLSVTFTRKDKDGNLVPFASGTQIQSVVTTDKSFNGAAVATFDKNQ